ncbi:MAG: hypothetical protein JWM96_711 [Alphaproteobacteria bacterium]|nr:hypothetical protein [Alphaproteobacteria bacterium]
MSDTTSVTQADILANYTADASGRAWLLSAMNSGLATRPY